MNFIHCVNCESVERTNNQKDKNQINDKSEIRRASL
jgi:hypothetical protein